MFAVRVSVAAGFCVQSDPVVRGGPLVAPFTAAVLYAFSHAYARVRSARERRLQTCASAGNAPPHLHQEGRRRAKCSDL